MGKIDKVWIVELTNEDWNTKQFFYSTETNARVAISLLVNIDKEEELDQAIEDYNYNEMSNIAIYSEILDPESLTF